MKKILYIITNISMPGICKVGITDNIEARLRNLNKTWMPTRFQVYETFDNVYVDVLEQKILQHFAEYRINRKREFFKIHPERICDYINDNKHIQLEHESDIWSKFQKIWLNNWDVLKFKEWNDIYPDIIATIWLGNSIIFEWRKSSLSRSAKQVLKEKFDKQWKAVQWTLFRTYQWKTIRELMDERIV